MGVDDLIVNIQTARRAKMKKFTVDKVENGYILYDKDYMGPSCIRRELVATTVAQLLKLVEKVTAEEKENKDVK